MKAQKYMDRLSNLTRENRLLKFSVLVFAIASVISAVTAYRSLNYTRTIITIQQVFPMFELSVDGLEKAVTHLMAK